jgi:hypothetical protein
VNTTARSDTATTNATADTSLPTFTDIWSNTTDRTANISLFFSESANITLHYGDSLENQENITSNATHSLSKTLVLFNLTPNTTYFFSIDLNDEYGNNNTLGLFNFTTLQEPDTLAPSILFLSNTTTASSITMMIQMDEQTNLSLIYNTTTSAHTSSFARNHTLTISSLSNATTYPLVLIFSDTSNNTATHTINITTQQEAPPLIQSITTVPGIHSALVIIAVESLVNATIFFGRDSQNLDMVASSTIMAMEQNITLSPLFSSSTYYFKVNITAPSGLNTLSEIQEVHTLASHTTGDSASEAPCYDWVCTNWGACENGRRMRGCYNLGACAGELGKPKEKEVCAYEPQRISDEENIGPSNDDSEIASMQTQQTKKSLDIVSPSTILPKHSTQEKEKAKPIPLSFNPWYILSLIGLLALYTWKNPQKALQGKDALGTVIRSSIQIFSSFKAKLQRLEKKIEPTSRKVIPHQKSEVEAFFDEGEKKDS